MEENDNELIIPFSDSKEKKTSSPSRDAYQEKGDDHHLPQDPHHNQEGGEDEKD